MQQEIEVKAKLVNPEAVVAKLQELGCQISESVEQYDQVYVPRGVSATPVPNGTNVFRIREQQGKLILTLKQPVSNQLDCIEKELEISNGPEMIDIFELLGFEAFSKVRKKRRKCKYNDLEICLDEVEQLGSFIEVEKLADDQDDEAVQKELFEFLKSLGVSENDRVFDGYDVLIAKLKQ